MKTLKVLSVAFLVVALFSCKQKTQESESETTKSSIKSTFRSQHPNAKDVEWSKDGEYTEVEFTENGVDKYIAYDSKGKVFETTITISKESLLTSIKDYVQKNYSEHAINEAEKVENSDGIFYELVLKRDGKEVELIFNNHGKLIDN